MNLKRILEYLIVWLILIFFTILFFYSTKPTLIYNETMFTNFTGLLFKDHSALITLIGIITAFLGTIYTIDMNFKASKLSSLPEDSVNLLIELEYQFNEYKIAEQKGEEDIIYFFVEILKCWKDNQKAFRLLTPKFYKQFLNFYSKPSNTNEKSYPEKNSDYIIKAMKTQIIDIALVGRNLKFFFINPKIIEDDYDYQFIEDSKICFKTCEINKKNLNRYIENIKGENTKKLTQTKFNELCNELSNLLTNLKNEIDQYDTF